jgi:TonB-linked SusC/RagA family outer membrane protein
MVKQILTMKRSVVLLFMMMICCLSIQAQKINVKGHVVDGSGEELIGATVKIKGNPNAGTITDMDGNFMISVPSENSVLVVTYVGMNTQEVKVGKKREFKITLADDNSLGEVVVVGYGQQKKASVVGSITQTTGEVLERAAGVSDIGAALTGNLPGVTTMQGNGMPGEEEPQIIIRGSSSWNNSDPLVLVDGIERPMSSVDISSVESISVLKDASATAVYGVKGANGVILITTKRGQEGKAKIDVGFNTTLKSPSKLPNKYDSYDALMLRNRAIEHELGVTPESWANIRSQEFINNYRNQTTQEQRERYPNVDWQDALFKDAAMSYNANVNVSGGTKFVRYFASADYVHEGDLFRVYDNGRNYKSGYGFDRINVRSNLDFTITPTTTLKVNLAGSNGVKKAPMLNDINSNDAWQMGQQWSGAYNIAPDVFLPKYSDGTWGYYDAVSNTTNSAMILSTGGASKTTTTRINTDFTLEQKLDFITKGLNFRATVSWDNNFIEVKRGINDANNNPVQKWINPDTGNVSYRYNNETNNKFDYQQPLGWTTMAGEVNNSATVRNLYYQAQLNWARKFGKHDVSAMGLFSRQENARGSVIPTYREDWAFRATYNYDGRYFIEYNGAYNGSEKFSKDNRFAFFNSGAIGWTVTEEKFMKNLRDKHIIDMLKFRASYGEIGDDNLGDPFLDSNRWLYMSQWAYGGNTVMDEKYNKSIYTWYREATIGNENVKWETVKKLNIGADYGFLGGLITGSFDVFRDVRDDILVRGNERSVPSYLGGSAPTANLGKVRTTGYEWEVKLNKTFANGLRLWGNFNMTHAKNKVLIKDDPGMAPSNLRQAGYAINQNKAWLSNGYLNNIDDLYGSPAHDVNENYRLVGDYYIIDYNGDGVVDSNDKAPYGYSNSPQNTYNATIGFEWKGFSAFAQFYGVTNVTREVSLTSFGSKLDTVFDQGSWWDKDNTNADVRVPRWGATTSKYSNGTQFLYDGSYIRLKNVEIAYTWTKGWIKHLGINYLKVYLNGNNLWLWTRMPDDRESNLSTWGALGAYPTVRRFNLGVKFTL